MVYQSPGAEVFDFPDSITTSPQGILVVCEDSTGDNYVRGPTQTEIPDQSGDPRHPDGLDGHCEVPGP